MGNENKTNEAPTQPKEISVEEKAKQHRANISSQLDFHILQKAKAEEQVKLHSEMINKCLGGLEALDRATN